ncbi:MAG: tripartite tricarboxylate transporter substrate binding protein [Peptococcaceae bacterium]|nr:tripartite tricarboxylate transporter substrate binding protein [Peptococcaceae bacterium]
MRKISTLVISILLVLVLVAGCANQPAAAPAKEKFPNKAISLVAHTAPGGGGDVFARQLGKAIQTATGNTVVIDNRSGGSGAVALQYVAESKPDGYTLLGITDTMIITPINNNIPKDLSSFKPVARVVLDPNVLYVRADSKWTADSMLEAIFKGKQNIKWAASQAGTPETAVIDTLIKKHNAKISSVLMGDGSKALTAVLGGDVEASVAEIAEIKPQLDAKQVKILMSFNSQRNPASPDIPTFAEKGYPDLSIDKFRGIAAPKDTPDEIVKILEDAIKKALEDPEYKKTYTANMQIPAFQGSAEFQKTITAKTELYKKAFAK